jgi:hypothetical protein
MKYVFGTGNKNKSVSKPWLGTLMVKTCYPNKVFVIESKASATGRFQLGTSYVEQGKRKVKVKQMSSEWIDKNIDLMVGSLDPQIKATGKLLQKNKTLIQLKASVLTPDGTVRFGKPTKSLPPFNSTE